MAYGINLDKHLLIRFPLAIRPDQKLLPPLQFQRGKAHVAKMAECKFTEAHPEKY